jgi:hypothetical protein
VLHGLDRVVGGRGQVAPHAQGLDHRRADLRGQHQAGRRSPTRLRRLDVGRVRRGDRGEDVVVGEAAAEAVEERVDCLGAGGPDIRERVDRLGDRLVDEGVLGGGDAQQVAGLLDDHEVVAGLEHGGEVGVDHGDAVPAEGHELPGLEADEWGVFGGHRPSSLPAGSPLLPPRPAGSR